MYIQLSNFCLSEWGPVPIDSDNWSCTVVERVRECRNYRKRHRYGVLLRKMWRRGQGERKPLNKRYQLQNIIYSYWVFSPRELPLELIQTGLKKYHFHACRLQFDTTQLIFHLFFAQVARNSVCTSAKKWKIATRAYFFTQRRLVQKILHSFSHFALFLHLLDNILWVYIVREPANSFSTWFRQSWNFVYWSRKVCRLEKSLSASPYPWPVA